MQNTEDVNQSILKCMRIFTTRQKIVLDAMRDTWPHLLIITGQEGDRATFLDALKRRDFIPQSGLWENNNEWIYFIHGTGCRLIHVQTGEPIEWDSPDLHRFDRYWFTNWLKWTIAQEFSNDSSSILQTIFRNKEKLIEDAVSSAILELENAGNIKKAEYPYSSKYILLPFKTSESLS